jgi:hypothetical protein
MEPKSDQQTSPLLAGGALAAAAGETRPLRPEQFARKRAELDARAARHRLWNKARLEAV